MDEQERIWVTLANTLNQLSERVSPQRDMTRLTRAANRGEWSVRETIAHLRDHEAQIFPRIYLIAVDSFPDLRRVAQVGETEYDPNDSPFMVMSQFRRLRQSTVGLLRELPRDAWQRAGIDVDNSRVTIQDLALELIDHDAEHIAQIDATLEARGALPYRMRTGSNVVRVAPLPPSAEPAAEPEPVSAQA